MTPDIVDERLSVSVRAAGIFVLWLAFLSVGGWLLGAVVSDPLSHGTLAVLTLYLPVYIYPFFHAVRVTSHGSDIAFSPPTQYLLAASLWVLAALAFAGLGRRYRTKTLVWIAPLLVLGVTVAVNIVLAAFGIHVEVDAP